MYSRTLAHRVTVGLVIAVGALLSGFTYLLVDQFQTARTRQLFERSALQRIESVERHVDRNLEVLRSLAGLFEASRVVERREFAAYVAGILRREKSIRVLEWVPRVSWQRRAAVEHELRRWSGREVNLARSNEGGVPPPEYFPVLYVEPYRGNEAQLGLDLAARGALRRVLEEARDSAAPTAGAAQRPARDGDGAAVWVVVPVYRDGAPATLAARRDRLAGYVRGLFRVADWIALTHTEPADGARQSAMDFYLYDDREAPQANPIHRWRDASTEGVPPLLTRADALSGIHLQRTFTVAGRPWSVVARPAAGALGLTAPWEPWVALLVGLLLTGLLAAYLQALLERTDRVEELVEERTALAAAQATAIEERDQRLRGIVEGNHDGIVTLDGDGAVRSLNPAAQRIFGCDQTQLLGEPFARLLGTDPRSQELRAAIAQWCEVGEPVLAGERREVTGRRLDGSRFPMEMAFARGRTDDRVLPTVFVTDLTQRRRLERELQRFFTLSLDLLVIVGADGRFQRCNPAWETVLGYTPEELRTLNFLSLIHPDDREATQAESMKLTRGAHVTLSFENRCRHKDGSYRVLTWNATASVEDSQIYAVARDVSEQRRQMERIELQSAALNAAANAIVITDPHGTITWINPAFTQLTGFDAHDALGRTPRILRSEIQDQGLFTDLWRTIREGRVWHGELINRRKDGSDYVESQTITPVCDGRGEISAYIGIKEDITLRKEAERQMEQAQQALHEANQRLKELDRLKSMFIASMSHELRTPLNSIIGFTGVILQGLAGDLNATQRDQLQRVYASAKHLLALISDVIDISKIEAEKIEACPEDFDLVQVIREAVADIEQQANAKGLALRLHLPDALPAHTDRRRILQCVLNLLSNAVKYTEAGEVGIGAAAVDDALEVSVSDTGIGIAEHDLDMLFEPFTRLDNELRISVPGTGLGLYLTRKLASELLAGEVRVSSSPGQGSTFVLRFKRDLAPRSHTEEAACEVGIGD